MANPVLQFKRGAAANVGVVSFKSGEPGFTTDKFDFYIGLDETAANNKFFGSARYWKRENGSNSAQVKLVDKDGTNFIGIAASDTLSGIATYRLPNTTNGTTNDFLKVKSVSNGFYDLEWTNALVAQTLKVNGNFYDSLNSNGTPGQFLVATGAGVTWTAIEGVSNGAISKVATTQTTDGSTYFLPFVANSTSTASETIRVDSGISYIPADDKLIVNGIGSFGNAYVSGISTLKSTTLIGGGTSTGTASQTLQVTGGAYVSGNLGIGSTNPTVKLWVEGSGRFIGSVTADSGFYVNGELIGGNISGGYITGTSLSISGVSTFSNGPVLIGGGTSTGTSSQPLQVTTGGAYVNGNLGIGSTNPTSKLSVQGDVYVSGVVTATTFKGALTGTASSATQLVTPRTISLSNHLSGSATFDGSSDITISATIQENSVALGSDTTGDYVESISGTANQINVSATSGEGSTPTLSIPNQFTIPQDATVLRDLQIDRNLNVNGNITIGGTTAFINVQRLQVSDADLVLGFRTDAFNNDNSNDTTANHGGIAIASTEGTPLVQLYNPGIGESTSATYKKFMWFKSGSFAGLGTDAWLSNYAIGIGSTQFPTGTRLAAGSVQFTENDLAAVRHINSIGIITATRFSGGTISGTSLNISTGISTLGFVTASSAYVTGVTTSGGVVVTTGNDYKIGTNSVLTNDTLGSGVVNSSLTSVGTLNQLNVSSSGITTVGFITATSAYVTGVTTSNGVNVTTGNEYKINGTSVLNSTTLGTNVVNSSLTSVGTLNQLNVSTAGITTVGFITATSAYVSGVTTSGGFNALTSTEYKINGTSVLSNNTLGSGVVNSSLTSVGTLNQLNVSTAGITTVGFITATSAYVSGVTTSNGVNVTTGNEYKINGTSVLSNNTLGSGVTASSLTSVGALGQLQVGTGITISAFSNDAIIGTGNSTTTIPTVSAVKNYVDSVDVTLGISADSGGTSTVNTSQTLTISGTTSEIETSVSGQTITIGLPNDIVVGTSLSSPTVKATNLKAADGTTSITITNATGAVSIGNSLTVQGNLFVNGTTTQINTDALKVEDRTIDLGIVNGAAPAVATTWDLGILFNYHATTAKKSAVIWEHGDSRFKFASILNADTDTDGSDTSTPQLTVNTFAPIEIGQLWVNDCSGSSQVISCTGTTRFLENITIDAGTF